MILKFHRITIAESSVKIAAKRCRQTTLNFSRDITNLEHPNELKSKSYKTNGYLAYEIRLVTKKDKK